MNILKGLSQKNVLIILGVFSLIFIAAISYLMGDITILDTKFFYLKSEIQILFHSLGEEGRLTYRQINLVDFLFIICYTLFFIGIYVSFFKELAKTLLVIPILLGIADLFETGIIYFLLNSFPVSNPNLELLLMMLTPMKWILALSTLLVIVNGYFVNLYIKKS